MAPVTLPETAPVDENQPKITKHETTKPVSAEKAPADDSEKKETITNDKETADEDVTEKKEEVPNNSDSAVDTVAEALEKLNTGKRNLACDEYPQAVEALADACQLLAEKYGEEGDELAEAYSYYGKALLELARMENGVLGNALDGVAAEEENEAELSESEQFEKASEIKEDEREDVRNQVYSAMSAEEKEAAKTQAAESADKADETKPSQDEKMVEDQAEKPSDTKTEGDKTDSAEASADGKEDKTEEMSTEEAAAEDGEDEEGTAEEGSADEGEGASSSQDEGEEDPDDVPNLQLSWEVLELSKKIYLKKTESADCDKEIKLKLSEVYRTLGEVSLETGAYDQAVQDMTSCLDIQTACMDADSRFIAETHYQLGNAHLLNKSYSTAVEELRKAKSTIESRISNLQKKVEEGGDDKDKSQKELDDLKQLLPDIIAKVEDVEDESRNADKAETEIKAAIASSAANGTTTIGFGDASKSSDTAPASTIAVKKANDISNLVRKRKPEDQEKTEEIKKAKSDAAAPTESGDKENGTKAEVTTNGQ